MQIKAVLHQSKTSRYVGFVAKRKKTDNHRRLLRNEVVPQKPINKFMIRLLSKAYLLGGSCIKLCKRVFRNLGGLNQKMGECDNFFLS